MFKTIRYFFYFLILSASIFAVYNLRTAFAVAYVSKYASKVSGHNIKIESFHLSPLKCAVVFSGASFDGYISADSVSVCINPFKAVESLRNPASYVKRIEISAIEIDMDKKIAAKSAPNELLHDGETFKIPFFNADILINSVSVKTPVLEFKAENTEIKFNRGEVSLSAMPEIFKNRFFFHCRVLQKQNGSMSANYAFFSNGSLLSFARGRVEFDYASRNISQSAVIKKLAYGKFSLSGSSFSFTKNENGAAFEMLGSFGKIFLNSSDLKEFVLSAQADLSKINEDIIGEISLDALLGKNLKACLKFENLNILGLNMGN
ncbi:MAG: hypothetical protein LBU09_05200, partial [Endomicrobium sp.]|nr:hypothetical protein [Endomicrobium sp.]